MPKFRHKPTEIEGIKTSEAMKAASGNWGALPKWLSDAYEDGKVLFGKNNVVIASPHGSQQCAPEDWIIHAENGQMYPCPDGILMQAYEAIE